MNAIFLQGWAPLLVVLHALAACVLLGSSTHGAIAVIGTLRGRTRPRFARIHAATTALAYLVTLVLGALAYPTYRYYARGLFLDRYAPWASNLFDIKENLASLGLPLALGAWYLRSFADPDEAPSLRVLLTLTVCGSTLVAWFATISGLLITMKKGV